MRFGCKETEVGPCCVSASTRQWSPGRWASQKHDTCVVHGNKIITCPALSCVMRLTRASLPAPRGAGQAVLLHTTPADTEPLPTWLTVAEETDSVFRLVACTDVSVTMATYVLNDRVGTYRVTLSNFNTTLHKENVQVTTLCLFDGGRFDDVASGVAARFKPTRSKLLKRTGVSLMLELDVPPCVTQVASSSASVGKSLKYASQVSDSRGALTAHSRPPPGGVSGVAARPALVHVVGVLLGVVEGFAARRRAGQQRRGVRAAVVARRGGAAAGERAAAAQPRVRRLGVHRQSRYDEVCVRVCVV